MLNISTELMFQVWLRLDANWPKIILSGFVAFKYFLTGNIGRKQYFVRYKILYNKYNRGHRGSALMSSLYKLTGTDRQADGHWYV